MDCILYKTRLVEITNSIPLLRWALHIKTNHPEIRKWIIAMTCKYAPESMTESIFIIFNGPPDYCKNGNKPRFVSYNVGYQKFCKQGCLCFVENASKKSKEIAANRAPEETAAIFSKVAATCLERYGTLRASATVDVIEKTKATNLKKYGHLSYIGSKAYQKKCLEKYGVTHYTKSDEIKNAISKTCMSKYGTRWALGASEVREKSKQTKLARYGNTDHMQNADVKKKMIRSCIVSGKYFRLEDKSNWYIYNTLSHFVNGFNDIIKSQDDKVLVQTYGIYNTKNKLGLVRDHIYSRREGYINNVFFEILRHPANCQLILHKTNCSKKSKSNITLEELFDRIRTYQFPYYEHDIVLNLIDRYITGERLDMNKLKLSIGGCENSAQSP